MISNKLVAEFGGKFTVNSDIGKGADFTFTIKLEEKDVLREMTFDERAKGVNQMYFYF
jgi:hypothetical protein